ncbi:MAG: hypothetical protein EOO85_32245 [Pedobacter sp.]|nr:MAG: hypothetical protein EOO85_32245 [Pedobacter sp.]
MKNSRSGASLFDIKKYILKKNLKKDLPASIVVFLVALPLCLGIALGFCRRCANIDRLAASWCKGEDCRRKVLCFR